MYQDKTIFHAGYRFSYRHFPSTKPVSASPPLIFVGGAFQVTDSFNRYGEAMREYGDIYIAALPGMDQSDDLEADAPYSFLADCLHEIVKREHLNAVNLIGVSVGAATAHYYALNYSDYLHRLILVGATERLSEFFIDRIHLSIRLLESGRLEEFVDEAIPTLLAVNKEKEIDRSRTAQRILRAGFSSFDINAQKKYINNSLRLLNIGKLPAPTRVNVPTLVYTGEHDALTPAPLARAFASKFPRGWFTALRRSDHLVNIENFAASVALKRFFLNYAGVPGNPAWTDPEDFSGSRIKGLSQGPRLVAKSSSTASSALIPQYASS